MEDLMKLTGWIIIIFGILQIILFFKVWVMTNDVREMKDLFVGGSDYWMLKKAVLEGDKTLISKVLFNNIFSEIKVLYSNYIPRTEGGSEKIFEESMANIKCKYKKKYLKYGIDFPEAIDKIEKPEDIENL